MSTHADWGASGASGASQDSAYYANSRMSGRVLPSSFVQQLGFHVGRLSSRRVCVIVTTEGRDPTAKLRVLRAAFPATRPPRRGKLLPAYSTT